MNSGSLSPHTDKAMKIPKPLCKLYTRLELLPSLPTPRQLRDRRPTHGNSQSRTRLGRTMQCTLRAGEVSCGQFECDKRAIKRSFQRADEVNIAVFSCSANGRRFSSEHVRTLSL